MKEMKENHSNRSTFSSWTLGHHYIEAFATFRFLEPASLILSFSSSFPFHLHHLHHHPPPQTRSRPRSLRSLMPTHSHCCCCRRCPSCWRSPTLKDQKEENLTQASQDSEGYFFSSESKVRHLETCEPDLRLFIESESPNL